MPYIVCNGLCSRMFHADCVGLDKGSLDAVSPPAKNSFWLCDECFTEFVKWREMKKKNTVPVVPVTNSELQRDVDELKAKVACIISTLACNATNAPTAVYRHSTPYSSPNLESGTSAGIMKTYSGISQLPDLSSHASDPGETDDSFALLLTNIDGSVSEENVQQMVVRCLGACDSDCKDVRKLVPRWIDSSSLDFVSFKVVLNRKWKSIALTSSTWPKNVKYREFIRRRSTWKPEALLCQ